METVLFCFPKKMETLCCYVSPSLFFCFPKTCSEEFISCIFLWNIVLNPLNFNFHIIRKYANALQKWHIVRAKEMKSLKSTGRNILMSYKTYVFRNQYIPSAIQHLNFLRSCGWLLRKAGSKTTIFRRKRLKNTRVNTSKGKVKLYIILTKLLIWMISDYLGILMAKRIKFMK